MVNKINYEHAGSRFTDLLHSKNGFFIGRIGGSDWDLVSYYYFKIFVEKSASPQTIIFDPTYSGLLSTVKCWNGFYDLKNDLKSGTSLCNIFLSLFTLYDFATVGNAKLLTSLGFIKEGEHAYNLEPNTAYRTALIGDAVTCDLCNYQYIEDLCGFLCEIFPRFAGRRILVCSPFSESVRRQMAVRGSLFTKHPNTAFKYPDFELVTLQTPVTYAGALSFPHEDWFMTSDCLCNMVKDLEFDIALLGCGAYAQPLGACIKSMGKGAIYIGGVLQLFFGLLGRRYSRQPYYQKFFNEFWISPLEHPDVPVGSDATYTEAWGAYW